MQRSRCSRQGNAAPQPTNPCRPGQHRQQTLNIITAASTCLFLPLCPSIHSSDLGVSHPHTGHALPFCAAPPTTTPPHPPTQHHHHHCRRSQVCVALMSWCCRSPAVWESVVALWYSFQVLGVKGCSSAVGSVEPVGWHWQGNGVLCTCCGQGGEQSQQHAKQQSAHSLEVCISWNAGSRQSCKRVRKCCRRDL